MLVDVIADHPEHIGPGFIFRGPVGTGKTWDSVAIVLYAQSVGLTAVCVQTNAVLREIRRTYSRELDWCESEIVEGLGSLDLLVLDDLGKESATPWADAVLFDIINARSANEKATGVTTNLSGEELARSHQLASVVDRLTEGALLIRTEGESLRRPGQAIPSDQAAQKKLRPVR